jgi:hypothetical protein
MSGFRHLEAFARAGFLARGIVYLLLGYFAWTTGGGEATTTVMERVHDMPLGRPALLLIALGLLGYGLFRIYSAWADTKSKGSDAKGLFGRAGPLMSGIAHLFLACVAVEIAFDLGEDEHDDDEDDEADEREMAGDAMELPGGTLLVGAAGLVALGAGVGNFVKAWTCAFMKDLSPGTPKLARAAGRAGYAARGIVFMVIGWQILSLAIGWKQSELGMESALQALRSREWLFPLVAIGLGAFGLFSLIMALYARIRTAK